MKLLCHELILNPDSLNGYIPGACWHTHFSAYTNKITSLCLNNSNITLDDSFIDIADNYFNTIYD